jgi:lambda family phage portal protein
MLDNTRNDGGIELGTFNEPVRYHFLVTDPTSYKQKKYSIEADKIINFFVPERPTQYRGVSEYKQAILDIKNFSAFQSATIQAMRARANIAYVVKQEGKASLYGADLDNQIQTVNGISVHYLRKGETISKLDPDSPPTDYVSFSESTIRLMATARNISFELAFRDYSKVNFASSRASILQDFKKFDEEQKALVDYILSDIFETWLELEVLTGRIKAPNFFTDKEPYLAPKWVMPKRDMVDPLKEITAIEKAIKLNLTTETDKANARGLDYEEVLNQKAKELEMKKDLELPLNNIAGLSYYEQEQIVDHANTTTSESDTGETDATNYDDNPTGGETAFNK